MTTLRAIHAGEPVMRIAALEEALDDALLEQPLQAPFGSQFSQVANCAQVKGARARPARAIHAACRRPSCPSQRLLPASLHDASNAVMLASVASNRVDACDQARLAARASTPRERRSLSARSPAPSDDSREVPPGIRCVDTRSG